MGAKYYFIGGNINIELKLEGGSADFEGLDSTDWYDFYGPVRRGGGEDETTDDKQIRWLQLLKNFDCTVTSAWAGTDDPWECHTWTSRSSIYDVVFEQDQDEDLGPFPSGVQN